MANEYSVYRGPGYRIVAISREPVGGVWIVKSGQQGKKLRTSEVPASMHSDFSSLKAEHISDGYQELFTGKIDAYGECVSLNTDAVLWEALTVDVAKTRQLLRELVQDLQSLGAVVDFVDDISGTRLTIDRVSFGISKSPAPGCINHHDGNGAGRVFPSSSADLICLIAILSESINIRMVDAEGNTLSRSKVVNRCASLASDPMTELLSKRGLGSLAVSLRKANVRQIRF